MRVSAFEEIVAYAKSHTAQAMELLCALAPIPAPLNGEQQRIAFCQSWLKAHGVTDAFVDAAGNLIVPFGDVSSHVAVVCAHADVVFADETPLPLAVRDGRIYCPGVGDDTANAVMLLMAAVYWRERGVVMSNGGLLLVVNVGEEGLGNLKGARQLLADYGERIHTFVSLDCYADEVIDRAVGSVRYRVSCDTVGGHSYFDFGRVNAVAALAALITALYAMPVANGTTFNVGTVSGGTSVNTIAQHAEMLYEIRSEDADALSAAKQQFETILNRYQTADARFTVTLLGERPCANGVDEGKQAALCDLASAVLTRYFGKEPLRKSGSTDCNIPLSVGIPSVCFGCIQGNGMHTREEYIETDSLCKGLCAAIDMIGRLL